MEKVEAVKTAITKKGRLVADQAKNLAEIARLKGQILTCEDVIRKNYAEIGQLVFSQFEEAREAEENGEGSFQEEFGMEGAGKKAPCEKYAKQCTAIANAKRAIADLNKKIKDLRQK